MKDIIEISDADKSRIDNKIRMEIRKEIETMCEYMEKTVSEWGYLSPSKDMSSEIAFMRMLYAICKEMEKLKMEKENEK